MSTNFYKRGRNSCTTGYTRLRGDSLGGMVPSQPYPCQPGWDPGPKLPDGYL